ncbi:MAG: bifunctional serine/threonine-protein kinase/formylglycine-generating enzyme family protein [Reichenbachiella sp.]
MKLVGKYKIIKELGAGGFGAVYLAQDPKLNELVAIKVFQIKDDNLARLATSATSDANEVLNQRFLNEARTLRQLGKNPHIVNVFDFDELDDGRPYYVMPYLPKSLKGELGSDATDISVIADLPSDEKPRRLPVSQALSILSQLLNALSDVHKAGLVHRDIKPANLLLNEDDEIQLCDFGIAKMPDVQHSQSGIGMGSRNYMAPEQRQSAKHVDARSDIYSVGVLAYRMITGTLPEGRFAEPNTFQPNLSTELNSLILKALEQQKENRFQDAAQMLKALKQAQQSQTNTDNEETGTWVGGTAETITIKTELKPLETKIIELLQKQGEVRASDKVYLQALADIADLSETGLTDLISQVTEQQLNQHNDNSSAQLKSLIHWASGINKRLTSNQSQLDDTYIASAVSAGVSTTGKSEQQLRQLLNEKSSETNKVSNQAATQSQGNQLSNQGGGIIDKQPSGLPKVALIFILLLLIIGGSYYGFEYYQTDQVKPQQLASLIGQPKNKQIPLIINIIPSNAKISLINYPGEYKSGINLKPGEYTVEITSNGFQRQTNKFLLTEASNSFQYQLIPEDHLFDIGVTNFMMKGIPGGNFNMGSNTGSKDEQPKHKVTINAFKLMSTEVTFTLWDACTADNGCKHQPSDEGWGRGERPVINVSYNEIISEFLPWLNKKLKLQQDKFLRLPTESEWEYAASSDEFLEYNIVKNRANCKNCGSTWDAKKTAPVKSFSAESYGLYDLYGNSYEWLEDCWHVSYNGAPKGGMAWDDSDCTQAVIRGGSWLSDVKYLMPSYRDKSDKNERSNTVGFRLAQNIE